MLHDFSPDTAMQGPSQQCPCRGVAFLNDAVAIQHHDPARQRIEQQSEPPRKALFLPELHATFVASLSQLLAEARDSRFQHTIGGDELIRHLAEDGERILEVSAPRWDRGTDRASWHVTNAPRAIAHRSMRQLAAKSVPGARIVR